MRKPSVKRSKPARPYHHGDLRQTLIDTAETLLAEKGAEGFTLRECARRARVSPAAPSHHFGNMTGLLTAIATLGFRGLGDSMEAAARNATTPSGRLHGIGRGYIQFALMQPARYRVMFGRFPLDEKDEAFAQASGRSFGILAETVRQACASGTPPDVLHSRIVLAWSVVHGFANLALDGLMPYLDPARHEASIATMADVVTRQITGAIVQAE